MHLSTNTSIAIMVFYSILTFFIGPFLTMPFMNNHPDQHVAGFIVGFTLSILLWMNVGKYYALPKLKY